MQVDPADGSLPRLGADLLLVHPPAFHEFRNRRDLYFPFMGTSGDIPITPLYEVFPLGFKQLRRYLGARGHQVRIVNLSTLLLRFPELDLATFAEALDVRLLGLDLHWMVTVQGCLAVARELKRLRPDIPIVLGGISASYYASELIQLPYVDMVMRGYDTLEPMNRLLESLGAGTDPSGVPNLLWKTPRGQVRDGGFTYQPPSMGCGIDWSDLRGGRDDLAAPDPGAPLQPEHRVRPLLRVVRRVARGVPADLRPGPRARPEAGRGGGLRVPVREGHEGRGQVPRVLDRDLQRDQWPAPRAPRPGAGRGREVGELRAVPAAIRGPDPQDGRGQRRTPRSRSRRRATTATWRSGPGEASTATRRWRPGSIGPSTSGSVASTSGTSSGCRGRTRRSVAGTVEYCLRLMEKFHGRPVTPMICPMMPFLDPGIDLLRGAGSPRIPPVRPVRRGPPPSHDAGLPGPPDELRDPLARSLVRSSGWDSQAIRDVMRGKAQRGHLLQA